MSSRKLPIPWSVPGVGKEELAEIADAFNADWLTMGPKVKAFEGIMAKRLGAKHAIAVSNGSVAIDIALQVAGIGAGDEVIVPSMTYFATAAAVSRIGGIPVFVDIEEMTCNLNPKLLEQAMSPKVKASIFIDYGGMAAQVDELRREAKKLGIELIQDAAQSLGAVYKGQMMGAQTQISTMSFHMAKILACVEGGMIFTHNDEFDRLCRIYRNQGESGKYLHGHLGYNARMTDITAAIGLVQERKLDDYLVERARIATAYDEKFLRSGKDIRVMPKPQAGCKHANFLYGIRVANRDEVVAELKSENIDTRLCYPMPLYRQQLYRDQRHLGRVTPSPVAEKFCATIVNLPMFPGMTEEQIDRITACVARAAK